MENKINKIMVLNNNKKYIVINQAIYKGVNYYFVVGITDNEEDVTDEFRIVQEIVENGKSYIKDVNDPQLLELLARYLKPVEE